MKYINWKFILTSTFTFIPYTALWFFWHNNLFPHVYYLLDYFRSIHSQNVWLMNFANALLVYGFVYFYFRSVKNDTKLINAVLWGVYYNLSVTGFFSFMMLGTMDEWNGFILIHEIIWATAGGAFSGVLAYYLYRKIMRQSSIS